MGVRGVGFRGGLSIPVLPDSTLSGVLLRTFLIPSDHLVHVIDEFVERTHRAEYGNGIHRAHELAIGINSKCAPLVSFETLASLISFMMMMMILKFNVYRITPKIIFYCLRRLRS